MKKIVVGEQYVVGYFTCGADKWETKQKQHQKQ